MSACPEEMKEEPRPGVVKSWACTMCAFMPILLRPFPPLVKGGLGGVVPEEPYTRLPRGSLTGSLRFLAEVANYAAGFTVSNSHVPTPPFPPLTRGGKGSAGLVCHAQQNAIRAGS